MSSVRGLIDVQVIPEAAQTGGGPPPTDVEPKQTVVMRVAVTRAGSY